MRSYRMSGLTVSSDIALPGLNVASPKRRPDVLVRRREVPETLAQAQAIGPHWQLADQTFLVRVPHVARFLLTGGREIAFQAEAGADDGDIPIYILGTVFGILLHQRGKVVLHASAVRVNGKAVLFCGPSGAGKSTLAAALAQRGYPLVTDDLCAVTVPATGIPVVHADGRHLKLWNQAIAGLDLNERRGTCVRSRSDKFYVDPGCSVAGDLPLGMLYALRAAHLLSPAIERASALDAALLPRRMAYRPRLIGCMGQKVNYFETATAVARNAGIFHLTRPLDFAALPEVVSMLERHWSAASFPDEAPKRTLDPVVSDGVSA